MEKKKARKPGAIDKSKIPHKKFTGSGDLLTFPYQPEHHAAVPAAKEYIGDRIRQTRETHGLTLQDLSRQTGIDMDTLKLVESNKAIPPLGELVRLGKALDTRMGYFISPGVEKPMTVVRADQRRSISRYKGRRKEKYGYSYESLAPEKADRSMEPFIVTLTPTGVEEPSTHDGEEFLFVLEGQMMARVGDVTEYLGPGDAVYYDSTQPHFVRCAGGSETKVLAVIYPGRL
jgi:transcriptional regulator with XRE-family HTH domain